MVDVLLVIICFYLSLYVKFFHLLTNNPIFILQPFFSKPNLHDFLNYFLQLLNIHQCKRKVFASVMLDLSLKIKKKLLNKNSILLSFTSLIIYFFKFSRNLLTDFFRPVSYMLHMYRKFIILILHNQTSFKEKHFII